jgi:hypothetical protein
MWNNTDNCDLDVRSISDPFEKPPSRLSGSAAIGSKKYFHRPTSNQRATG